MGLCVSPMIKLYVLCYKTPFHSFASLIIWLLYLGLTLKSRNSRRTRFASKLKDQVQFDRGG